MSMQIGFIVFTCFDDFPYQINKNLTKIFKTDLFKEQIYNNILYCDLNLKLDSTIVGINSSRFLGVDNNDILRFYKLFPATILEQRIIIVALEKIDIFKDETIKNYQNRLENNAKEKLYNFFDNNINQKEPIVKIASLIFLSEDEKDFNDTNSLIKIISNFLVGSFNVPINSFKEINNINYIIDSLGIGTYSKDQFLNDNTIDKVMLLLVLSKGYLLSFDQAIKLMIDIISQQKYVNTLNFFDIKNYLFELNKFFVCNYFDNPININNNNEIYYLYKHIKTRFKLQESLLETLSKIKSLKNIYNLE